MLSNLRRAPTYYFGHMHSPLFLSDGNYIIVVVLIRLRSMSLFICDTFQSFSFSWMLFSIDLWCIVACMGLIILLPCVTIQPRCEVRYFLSYLVRWHNFWIIAMFQWIIWTTIITFYWCSVITWFKYWSSMKICLMFKWHKLNGFSCSLLMRTWHRFYSFLTSSDHRRCVLLD